MLSSHEKSWQVRGKEGGGGGTTEEAAQGAAAASASTPNQVPYVKHTPQEPYQLPSGRQMDRI